ncbi:MAG TPA: ABC transporter permease subunit [Holophagaceae bacterium]|nr:ABC transporter permease subunit [Holophagaceae bacterium]
MSSTATRNLAKRVDRFMAALITGGGLLIILAVLGILFFIAKEALPLFFPARTQALSAVTLESGRGLWAEDSAKTLMIPDPAKGIRVHLAQDGRLIDTLTTGPALPWQIATAPNSRGQLAVVAADGRLYAGELKWSKPAGAQDPAQWTPDVEWTAGVPLAAAPRTLLDVRALEAGGLMGGKVLRAIARTADGLVWGESPAEGTAPLAWKPLPAPGDAQALLSPDGQHAYVGTREGRIQDWALTGEATLATEQAFPEPVSALGFALGGSSLLVGGERGAIWAYQQVRDEQDAKTLQPFHRFAPLGGPVAGFQHGLRDKRFLAWGPKGASMLHLTSERELMRVAGENLAGAALSARGDHILLQDGSRLRPFLLDAPHPEISWKTLWGRVHYEGYKSPEYTWQSTGGGDDFEPKLSLLPLLFGTLKGTFYALLFAVPIAILGALYTSQFATPGLKSRIKPTIEIMAALPSVVLGFLAGLVMAPLFEQAAVHVLVFPAAAVLLGLAILPLWSRLPGSWRRIWGEGREALWMVPLLLAALALTFLLAPAVEKAFMGGNYRTWLQEAWHVRYDQRNSLVVGFAMGFAVIPIIFTISEDALSSVPKALTSASLACGASPWQTAWRVVLPTGSPGIFSAVMVGVGRAIGETMIVLMATGNTPILDWGPFNGMRTLSANIAVEIPEAPHHGTLYRILFLAALLLFILTFSLNTIAELVRQHLRKKYESY